jgi:hypothetical protein
VKRLLLAGAAVLIASPAWAQEHSGHPAPAAPAQSPQRSVPPAAEDHSGHQMPGMDHGKAGGAPAGGDHGMQGALGDYPMTREASGTSWQPDASQHAGVHVTRGDWSLMGHVLLNGVYDWQDGPRGDEKTFVSGMVMGIARRRLGSGTLQLRTMLAPDPLMGKRGYPLLLASGETADGVEELVDRQHPHDLFMELSASYSWKLGDHASAFLYGGLPGEAAFGPPAFMHRASIMDSPEAPISHHWLDSTHIVFGVVTAGVTVGDWKLDVSRFRGREPDQDRYDIESGALDSTAARLSWNPTSELSLQASWADQKSPEQLHREEDVTKWSASAIFSRRLAGGGTWSTTAAWGRKSSDEADLDAYVVETSVHPNEAWTVFARAERTENDELAGDHGPTFTVSKASIGAVRDFRLSEHAAIGVGGLYALNFVPRGLEPSYGGDPGAAMAFIRLKLD